MKKVVEVKMNVMQELSVSSWEELAAAADAEHQTNLSALATLQRQRAHLALQSLVVKDPSLTREIDEEIGGLERRMAGHHAVRQMLATGLEAARQAEQAQMDIDRAAVMKTEAARRVESAAAVDLALEKLASAMTAYLDSSEAAARPDRAQGNVRRSFHYWFAKAGYRGRPGWWRQAVSGMSEPTPIAQVAPLSSTIDPAVAEAAALEQAATAARAEALERLKSLTPTLTAPPAKPRQNRLVEPLEIAA